MPDQDPHHLHPSGWELYLFLILAPVLVALVLYGGAKLMNRLENRENRREGNSAKNDD